MTDVPGPRRAVAPTRGRAAPRFTAAGLVVLVLGLAALGWSAWEVFGRPVVDPEASARAVTALRNSWDDGAAPAPAPGDPVAVVTLPGAAPVVVHRGTDAAVFDRGLGWYEGTAAPGAVGNFAVAGRGDPNGPLAGLAARPTGTRIEVETADAVHTYALRDEPGRGVVGASDTWVLQPVPGRPELRPTEALLTLTTTHDLFRPGTRSVAFGVLVDSRPR